MRPCARGHVSVRTVLDVYGHLFEGLTALAVLDYLVGPLLQDPQRVGKPLRGDLAGLHSARVGAYRIVYEIEEANRTVRVIYIDRPADIYRPR